MTLTLYGHRPDLGLCLAQQVKETVSRPFPAFSGIASRPFRFLLRLVFLLLLSVSLWQPARANDIKLNSVSVATGSILNGGTSDATVAVTIGLSWNNSWRTSFGPANWDAAWVFIKYRVGTTDPQLTGITTSSATFTVANTLWLRVGMPVSVTSGTGAFASGTVITAVNTSTRQVTVSNTPTTALSNATITCYRIWEHAKLSNTGHTPAAGYTVDMGRQNPASVYNADNNPNLGAFIYRSSSYSGNNTNFNTTLRWNIGRGGQGAVEVRVFAIEMVYVPQGSFTVGDGASGGAFTSTTINTATANASGGYPTGQTAPSSASWPNGYNAFYCMKYEISQAQYRDFLNTLTRTQQVNRVTMDGTVGRYAGGYTNTANGGSNGGDNAWSSTEITTLTDPANRNGLRLIADPGGNSPRTYGCDLNKSTNLPNGVDQSDDGEWIAMSQLNWADGCAYMDWAGLRPMTELEFEKACRGPQTPVANEYAWGTASATNTGATSISNSGRADEGTNSAGANSAIVDQVGVTGPMRVGAFAGAATTRVQAGATYYGIVEMSGNMWERPVYIGDDTGRSFTGAHGDGSLSTNGHANTTSWPGLNGVGGEVTGFTGSMFRGGSWLHHIQYAKVSDRSPPWITDGDRACPNGFRGVRSAQ